MSISQKHNISIFIYFLIQIIKLNYSWLWHYNTKQIFKCILVKIVSNDIYVYKKFILRYLRKLTLLLASFYQLEKRKGGVFWPRFCVSVRVEWHNDSQRGMTFWQIIKIRAYVEYNHFYILYCNFIFSVHSSIIFFVVYNVNTWFFNGVS